MAARHTLLLLIQMGLLFVTMPSLTVTPQAPHFTACLSREQETFRCWWSPGSFWNLSEPGALRVFFLKRNARSRDWMECPEYSAIVPNECYFSKSYTSIWTSYCIQLRSRAQNVTYDERCFNVEDIVHPDPPIGLNWTLLNVSRSGLHYDIIVHWEPPPSADVKAGWMSLVYEVHYRERNASRWDVLDLETATQQSIYGLHTNVEYEVRVRCKMRAFENFGEFSDSVFVYVEQKIPKESTFPVTVVFIFGVVGVVILFMLIIFFQQRRLMVIFLPPIPAPKIKGIDPELLKKGRLDELSSVLSSHPLYKPEMYREDSWVEFIELDPDRTDTCEKNSCSDTQQLLGLGSRIGSARRTGVKGDTGHASCYNPKLLEAATEPEIGVTSPSPQSDLPTSEVGPTPSDSRPIIPTHLGTQSWVGMDFYAQVSDVTPGGGVVLSPGQHTKVPEKTEQKEEGQDGQPLKHQNEVQKREEEDGGKKIKLHLLMVAPESGMNTTDADTQHICSDCSSGTGYQDAPMQTPWPPAKKMTAEHFVNVGPPVGEYQSPYFLPPAPPLTPVADYTVVQDVDAQQSLLLNPSSPPPVTLAPVKLQPAMAAGYLTPDLLGNISL